MPKIAKRPNAAPQEQCDEHIDTHAQEDKCEIVVAAASLGIVKEVDYCPGDECIDNETKNGAAQCSRE